MHFSADMPIFFRASTEVFQSSRSSPMHFLKPKVHAEIQDPELESVPADNVGDLHKLLREMKNDVRSDLQQLLQLAIKGQPPPPPSLPHSLSYTPNTENQDDASTRSLVPAVPRPFPSAVLPAFSTPALRQKPASQQSSVNGTLESCTTSFRSRFRPDKSSTSSNSGGQIAIGRPHESSAPGSHGGSTLLASSSTRKESLLNATLWSSQKRPLNSHQHHHRHDTLTREELDALFPNLQPEILQNVVDYFSGDLILAEHHLRLAAAEMSGVTVLLA